MIQLLKDYIHRIADKKILTIDLKNAYDRLNRRKFLDMFWEDFIKKDVFSISGHERRGD